MVVTGPKVRDFKPGRGQWILMAVQIYLTAAFGEEVKASVPCRKILRHVKKPYRYERDTSYAKFTAIFRQVSPASLPDASVGFCQRGLVDELSTNITQMGMSNRSEMTAVLVTPCSIPFRNTNSMKNLFCKVRLRLS
jgi:hypothetical protein